MVAAREGTGTDLSVFDGSLKHCSERGAVITLTIPPFSLLCCNEHGLRGRLVTKHHTRLGEVYKVPARTASEESSYRWHRSLGRSKEAEGLTGLFQ